MSLLNVELNDILKSRPIELPLWDEVFVHSRRHTQINGARDLYEINRPLENPIYTEYRYDNKRPITFEIVSKWNSKAKRIYGETFGNYELPEIIKEHLDKTPYFYLGEKLSLDEWCFNCILPLANESPNDIVLDIPYNPNSPTESIAENGTTNIEIDCRTVYVCYDDIVYINQECLVWRSPESKNLGTEDDPNWQSIYWGLDAEAYYRYLPFVNSKKETEYRREAWYVYRSSQYTHPSSHLPYTTLPARIVSEKHKDGYVKYKVPFIFSSYAHGAEAVINHSNYQVMLLRHGYPKMWVDGLLCSGCGGKGHLLEGRGADKMAKHVCGDCKGTGMPLNIGPFETLHTKGTKNQTQKSSGAPAGYLTMPTAILDHARDIYRTNLEDMKRSIGLDILEGTANESGRAKELRLEALHDLIKEYGDAVIEFKEKVLNNKQILLVPNPNDREEIKLHKPKSYQIKSLSDLKENIKNCPRPFRFDELMKIAKLEFKGNEEKIEAYRLSLKYSPLSLYDDVLHRRELVAGGVYPNDALIKADLGQCAFSEILRDPINANKSDKELFDLANEWFIENGHVSEPVLLQDFEGGVI